MSSSTLDGQKAAFEQAFGLMMHYIDVCPEEVWTQRFGGWPVWQQIYHALGTCRFFTLQGGETPDQGLYPPEVGSLQSSPDTAPSKQELLAFAARMKAQADAYLNALRDADLPGLNQGLTARMRELGVAREFSHSWTAAMLAGHMLYHLGSCDAALREKGLKGVF